MKVCALGNFGLKRRVTPLASDSRVKARALLRFGLCEQRFRQRPRLRNQSRIKAMVNNGCKAIGLE